MSYDSTEVPTPSEAEQPADSRITRETTPGGAVMWHLPPSGHSGGMLFFAIFWITITGIASGSVVAAFLEGQSDRGNFPGWGAVAFLSVFWAAGLFLLYVALRYKYAWYFLAIDGERVVLTRRLFGREKTESLATPDVRQVRLAEFYRSNYKPVHGIEIQADTGKIRFGSILTADEKRWLVADVRTAIFGSRAPAAPPVRQDTFSLPVPNSRKHLTGLAIAMLVLGLGFFAARVYFTSQAPGSVGSLEFRIGLWEIISGALALGGVAMLVHLALTAGQEMWLVATPSEIAVRTCDRAGRTLKEQTFARASVTDLRSRHNGHSGGKSMKKLELVADSKTHALRSWVEGAEADAFIDQARAALGWAPQVRDDEL